MKLRWTVPPLMIFALFALAACGSNSELAEARQALPWPPDDSLARSASDESVVLLGRQFAETGGDTTVEVNQLKFGPSGGNLTWAIYSLQGFGPDAQLGNVEVVHTRINSGFGDQTRLTIGLANYTKQRWDWFEVTPQNGNLGLPGYPDYISPGGTVHVAAVLSGNGYARLQEIHLDRIGPGANVPVPENLTSSVLPGRVNLEWDPVQFASGYNIYRATDAAFSDQTKVNLTAVTQADFADMTMLPFTNYWYRVTTERSGQESAPSSAVMITTIDSKPAVPTNFTATADVGRITLSWSPVLGATQYRVERATNSNFGTYNSYIAITNSYEDMAVQNGTFYFYRVVAVGQEDSDPSEMLDIYAPRADLPAPTNFRIESAQTSGDWVTFAWDWDHPAPDGFRVWLHFVPNFFFNGQEFVGGTTTGGERSVRREGLPSGMTLHARIAAFTGTNQYGRMSDSIPVQVSQYRSFGEIEEIVTAPEPYYVVSDGTDLTLAYFSGTAVRTAQRNAGSWLTNIPTGLNSGYATGLDMASNGEQVIIGALHNSANDCWVSIRNGGTWTPTRIHGDGSTADDREFSGSYVRVAASETEFAATHLYVVNPLELLLHTRPVAGGSWTEETILNPELAFVENCLAYQGGVLHGLNFDVLANNLLYGSTSDSFAWQMINPVDGDGIGNSARLMAFGAEFLSPGYDASGEVLYAYQGTNGTFELQEIIRDQGALTRADIAVEDDRAMMTWVVPSNPPRMMYAELIEGDWEPATIFLPGVQGVGLRVVAHAGEFYVVFEDGDGMLKCARALPLS